MKTAMKKLIIPILLSVVSLIGCEKMQAPQLQNATLLADGKAVADFSLVNHDENPFTQEQLKNRWTFMFFGYTHCPDVCPNSLSMLGRVRRNLDDTLEAGEQPQVVFVSVDPARDTPELLKKYTPYFHPSFTGVTGSPDALKQFTLQLGILYLKTGGDSKADYLVDHSASILLFNPDGDLYALFGVPHDANAIESDFLAIKTYYEQ